ncbi:hypothetical protein PBI_ACHEBE_16 [Mycobacterium phage Achebe]|uniref:Head-to-tail connector protein n=1 Tax=Mycobacterium phage Backyardigan TaxID=2902881 RepID=G1BKY9_9CAUD|nr:head-tail connector protein [Mycobacterium phage Wile]YP_009635429.1 head-tail connector protein [Mycobacterium phage Backyardigan]AOT27525.1 hypothetical protein SEA_BADGER_16 [Mycobacterium phage Badger]APD17366.1 hypothetical protein PBI_ACHEBE_16 [Mycobacterium phage Achebe]ASZ73649.1 hypothetical protein SEA_MORPHER26_16 [Mycobacterium phage Morpher26]AZS11628.1 hypothetical protein SEA_CICI_16 [Mycobacterium phage Cici]QAY05347.1 hypothetical protein SEA_KATALIE136_16 [Mycobacterium 
MKIRNKANGGVAEVTEDYGTALIAGGGWEVADAPKRQRAKKSTPKPAETPADDTPETTEVPDTEE